MPISYFTGKSSIAFSFGDIFNVFILFLGYDRNKIGLIRKYFYVLTRYLFPNVLDLFVQNLVISLKLLLFKEY